LGVGGRFVAYKNMGGGGGGVKRSVRHEWS